MAYGDNRRGRAVSKPTLSRWISDTICLAYEHMGRELPVRPRGHSTRGVAASWAEMARAGLPAICEAATWSNTLTFARFYRLDFAGTDVSNRILGLASHP